MRITIGHILLTGVAGFTAFHFYSSTTMMSSDQLSKGMGGMVSEVQSWVHLFQSGESLTSTTKIEELVPLPPATTDENKSENPSVPDINNAPVETTPPVTAVVAEPLQQPLEVKPSPVSAASVAPVTKKRVRKYRRSTTATALAPKTQEKRLAASATPKMSVDQMVGAYVRVELTSGKKIMGILQEKNAKEVKIQLPGMGPFSYPSNTVKSIVPAE